MSVPPDPRDEAREWIRRADGDLNAARHLLSVNPRPAEVICYLSQQAVEKYLKAALIRSSTPFPKSHDLVLLRGLVPGVESLELPVESLETLTRYAIEARYPGAWFPIDADEAESAVRLALDLCTRLCSYRA